MGRYGNEKSNALGKTVEQKRWTRQSTMCYYLGFNCKKCDIPEDIVCRCQMKATVLELVREFGKPPKRFLEMIKQELEGKCISTDSYLIGE